MSSPAPCLSLRILISSVVVAGAAYLSLRPHALPAEIAAHIGRVSKLGVLLLIWASSAGASEIIRVRPDNRLAWAVVITFFPPFIAFPSRIQREPGSFVTVLGALATALWLGVVVGWIWRRRTLAFWCAWLVGGVTASAVLWPWISTRAGSAHF
jgi:hypothetical protein